MSKLNIARCQTSRSFTGQRALHPGSDESLASSPKSSMRPGAMGLSLSNPANNLPTDCGRHSSAESDWDALDAAMAPVSGLERRSGHPLKVGTRVRTPLGLLN